jgi:hypothetical protein
MAALFAIFARPSCVRPDQLATRATCARPESITATTPSIVTLVSATFVAKTTLRRVALDRAVLLGAGERAVEGQEQEVVLV